MEKPELDQQITEITKSILSYARVRTSDQFEAEDLAQDIILELYKSAANIRNDEAFYGFMWAVAGNVYKQWSKRKSLDRQRQGLEPFDHTLGSSANSEGSVSADFQNTAALSVRSAEDTFLIENCDNTAPELYLLRRELTLLSLKYRKVTVLYYLENRSCSEIANVLSLSESMVKYLLFKSRQILKEGMSMERNYGKQSYDPKELSIKFWGDGGNPYGDLVKSRISQNILFACYNDKLSAEQISLEIGVALPYMEDKLEELLEYELVKKEGNRYFTNITIITNELTSEIDRKTSALQEKIADILMQTLDEYRDAVRNLGFSGSDMNANTLTWQICSILLHRAIIDNLQNRIQPVYPMDKFGRECFVWGEEAAERDSLKSQLSFGTTCLENADGDHIRFMDFLINGEMVHHSMYNRQNMINIFLDIARGKTENFSENDLAFAAELVRKGSVRSDDGHLSVNAPIFSSAQYQKLLELLSEPAARIADEAETLMDAVAKILKNHMPVHLKKQARDFAYLRLFADAISAPMAKLVEKKYLLPYGGEGILPTTYVVLK